MKIKLFGGCMGASLLVSSRQDFYYEAVTVTAPTREIATDALLEEAKKRYPQKKGFFSHFSQVAEVTEKQIQTYLNS